MTKQLTKLQRYTAYCIMLATAEELITNRIYSHGLCWITAKFDISENQDDDDWISIHNYLPELHKKLSRIDDEYYRFGHSAYEFTLSGWRKRIELLKKCIIETHP